MPSVTLTTPVLSKYKNRVFIETGTFAGGGILLALENGFQEVHSIEFDLGLYEKAVGNFKDKPGVVLHHGSSAEMLPWFIHDYDEPMTFWLDAHSETYSPLWDELRAIAEHQIKAHTILVDDRRLWPQWNLNEEHIRDFIRAINPAYRFRYEPNFVNSTDIFVAYLGDK